ncbi:methyltransferase domain-containing protein [Blastococcus deserti]|uniref:Methyltransferase domain-containing protein n=1 Tax=Blastococcus deserti TaxID=2259033 RepID=A0ABW4XDN8_9ACTN
MTTSTLYDENFFDDLRATAHRSAEVVVPLVLDLIAPRSVVDVGCGLGTWLSVFHDLGVEDVCGIDGDYVDRRALDINADHFVAGDLSSDLVMARTFDLAVSLEVAEHLPSSRAPGLVRDLTRLAPVVLFSAAAPHQGGTGHVNGQWPEYWAALFDRHAYRAVDCIRPQLWSDERVSWWYAQNTILYVREDHLPQLPRLGSVSRWPGRVPLRMVHPGLYLQWVDYAEQVARERWS